MAYLSPTPCLQLPFPGTIASGNLYQGYGCTGFTSEPSYGSCSHFHRGWDFDFDGNPGHQLYAPAAGTVAYAGLAVGGNAQPNGGYGLMIIINHDNVVPSLQTLYGHLSAVQVAQGQPVYAGQPIALSGGAPPSGPGQNSGNSTGAHLHWEVDYFGQPSNPSLWLLPSSAQVFPQGQPVGAQSGDVYASPELVVYWARQAGVPEDQIPTAVAIAYAESRLRINASHLNPGKSDCGYNTTDYGLWQINTGCHPQYDAGQLVTDGAYNARAMASISSGGCVWTWWSTYGDGGKGNPYYAFLPQGQSALRNQPPGAPAPQIVAPTYAPWPGVPQTAPAFPQDNTPQMPPVKVRVTPLVVKTPNGTPSARTVPRALLEIDGLVIPMETLSCHVPGYTNSGTWQGRISTTWLAQHGYTSALQKALGDEFAQSNLYFGYLPTTQPTLDIRDLDPVFVGFLDQPREKYASTSHDYVDLSGPDISGLFSADDSTDSMLSNDSFVNKPAHQLVLELVDRHNIKKGVGLTVDYKTSPISAGEFFGADFVKTRTSGQTEWDIITQLGQGLGYVTYWRGTTLIFKPLPPAAKPQPIDFALNGQPPSSTTDIEVLHKPHSKRSYRIVVASYNTQKGYTIHAVHGNADSNSQVWVDMPPNTSYGALHAKGLALQALYAATEVVVKITTSGYASYEIGTPVYIRSDRVLSPTLNQLLYPFDIEYDYDSVRGATTILTCTTRAYAVLDTLNATEIPQGF